jgi:quercetin dioxygenase-like cupin family protein
MDDRTRTELEAAAFRRLLQHLDERKDVQNIDLMNLAGFCRNCLSKWYKAAADEKGVAVSDDQAREAVYGMPYGEWKKKSTIRQKTKLLGRTPMRPIATATAIAMSVLFLGTAALAQDAGLAKPNLVLKQSVEGLPRTDKQEVSVLTATLNPGDKTPFHTHRFPVTVYVLEGAFTLELEGREPVVLKAGEAMVEPHNVRMTGYNRLATESTKVVIFYVADPGTPFLDMAH